MAVCNSGCRKYEERRLAYERQLDKEKHDKNVQRQITYSSSSASPSNVSIQNADYRSIKSGVSEYQSCSEETSDSEDEYSPVTPIPKCTPRDERNVCTDKKREEHKSGRGLPEGATTSASQSHHSSSKNKYTSPIVKEDVSKYFRGYVLAEESDDDDDDDDDDADDVEIEFEKKLRLMKDPREGQASKSATKSRKTGKTLEPRQHLHDKEKERKQAIFEKYLVHGGLRCFENLCFFRSLECTTKMLEDPFIKQTVISTVFFFLGIRLCQELDSWYIPF